uniref:Putative microvillar protein with insect allergen related repeat n=1 Tax=Nyssomyia neivai TaxID=330878 RepID=A0A1L8DR30_9DIPT
MKISIVVLIALGAFVATAAARPSTRGLKEDADDFLKLVNLPQVKRIALKYYTTDKETKQFVKYLKGETFTATWEQVFTNEHVLTFFKYVQRTGVDVQSVVNQVAKFLKKPSVDFENLSRAPGKGLNALVLELLEQVPLDKFKALVEEKLASSPEFKQFFDTVSGFDYAAIKEFVANSPELLDLFNTVTSYGVDLEGYLHEVENFFGWN